MKAFILAAGLGTRLKPWTLSHPKALVPVGDVPMLGRVIENLNRQGIDDITLNIHHFGDQILDFLKENNLSTVKVSDERNELLDTGGALLHASPYLCADSRPILVHNVDIISNADFRQLLKAHVERESDITLLVSDRESSRKLIFDSDLNLRGWHYLSTGEMKPTGMSLEPGFKEFAFSGIYIVSPSVVLRMGEDGFSGKFSIIDYFIAQCGNKKIKGYLEPNLKLIDIGKPETLARAQLLFEE